MNSEEKQIAHKKIKDEIEYKDSSGDSDVHVEYSVIAGNIAVALMEESLEKGNEVYIPSLDITYSRSSKSKHA